LSKNSKYWFGAGGIAFGLLAREYINMARRSKRRRPALPVGRFSPMVAENRPQTYFAWRGPSMIVLDAEGFAGGVEESGFFFRQTRFVRDLRLELFKEAPHLCSIAETAPNELECFYVYPEKKGGGSDRGGERYGIPYGALDIGITYRIRANGALAALRITNRFIRELTVDLGWRISADFADRDEVSGDRKQFAEVGIRQDENVVRFRYQHRQLPFETVIRIIGPGIWEFSGDAISSRLVLSPQAVIEISLDIRAVDYDGAIDDQGAWIRDHRLSEWERRLTSVETPENSPIASITNQSMHDIGSMALLEGSDDEWLTPGAGIPVFQSLWARDALTTAWQATVFDRGELADSILTTLGRLQGTRHDPSRDEQPGRIIRGRQHSPLARLNFNTSGLYYGDYASPFAFIFTLAQLYAWSGDKRYLEKHFDAARRILDWAARYGDIDHDGYLEYKTLSPDGPKHQGWRDAQNAVVYPDGTQVETPIATCEIQGYWFAAQQIMAVLSAVRGNLGDAFQYWSDASLLKKRFNRDFWMPHQNCVALGLDPFKRQIQVVSSNAAQTVTTGIVVAENLPLLVERLFEPDIFSGWGIRTISTHNPAYNPLSYHLGSVWPVENATFLFGLKRFGFEKELARLSKALYDLALTWRHYRIPECVGGYSRSEAQHPGAYPQANAPQTWNQSVFPILIQSLLGILPLASAKLLSVYPVLPDWLPEVTIRNLRVADATVSIRFWRTEHGTSKFEVADKKGNLHVIAQPPIESRTAGIWDRLASLFNESKAA
jgi:glycogen debranching enzyme